MKYLVLTFVITMFVAYVITEPMTSIQIQNYDGPIYLHSPPNFKEDISKILQFSKDNCHRPCDRECSCVSKPSARCVPINTASESSCTAGTYYVGNYQQCTGNSYCPAPVDTQYYTVDAQRHPAPCIVASDYRPAEHCSRDEKCLQRCNKCSY